MTLVTNTRESRSKSDGLPFRIFRLDEVLGFAAASPRRRRVYPLSLVKCAVCSANRMLATDQAWQFGFV